MDDTEVRSLIYETLSQYTASLDPQLRENDGDSSAKTSEDGESLSLHSDERSALEPVPGISRLKDAIGVIPNEEKGAFIEACCYCPDLVQQESHPKKFLMRHDYNILKAARGLVQYWTMRREIFGDRAYLPLNLSGRGALNEEDVEAMRSGFLMILPPDNLGRQVLFSDFARAGGIRDGPLLRASFFVRSILSFRKDAPKSGYVGIERYNRELRSVLENPVAKTLSQIRDEGMPTCAKMTYVVKLQKWTLLRLLEAPPDLSDEMWKQITPLVANSVGQLREKLQKLHFDLSSIPEILGGSWNLRNFHSWLRAQEAVEAGMSVAAVARTSSYSLGFIGNEYNLNVDTCVKDVIEALELIPVESKLSYLEAMATSPFLVRTESNPMHFLRCESGDSVAAAGRIVRYWEWRKKWFQERAFNPFTFQEGGVFSDIERERLKRFRTVRVLPCDKRGRPVIWWDPAFTKGVNLTQEEKRKYWCYMYSIVAEQIGAQKEGALHIGVPTSTLTKSAGSNLSSERSLKEAWNSLPLKSVEPHYFTVSEGSNVEFLSLTLNALPRNTPGNVAQSKDQVFEELVSIGLRREGIPVEWGGLWGLDEEQSWRRRQDGVEENRRAAKSFQLVADAVMPRPNVAEQDDLLFLQTCFEETMIEALAPLSKNEKAAVLHALASCSEIVRNESDPWKYVALESGNLPKAARRIAQYWSLRQELFGDAAFLPSGSNLDNFQTAEDKKAIEEGKSLVLLPGLDYHNRHMFFVDSDGDFTSVAWRRTAFFALSRVCSAQTSGKSEAVLIFRAVDSIAVSRNLKVTIDLIDQTFPLKLSRLFVCFLRDPEDEALGANDTAVLQLEIQRDMREALANSTSVQLTKDSNELIDRLEQYHGIRRESLNILISDHEKQKAKVVEKQQSVDNKEDKQQSVDNKEGKEKEDEEAPIIEQNSPVVDYSELLEQALHHIPISERRNYERARMDVPDLVESESNPNLFLKYENNDPAKAAERLTRYWKQRCQAFGNVAMQALNQTGESALNKKDVTNMSSGYLALLPSDTDGRPVLLHDCSRIVKRDIPCEKRILFYWAKILALNEVTTVKGVVLLIVMDDTSISPQIARLFDLTHKCFPFHYHSAHLVSCDPKQVLPDSLAQSMSSLPGADTTQIHLYNAMNTLAKLQVYGFESDGIPESLGGSWSYEKFAIWQEYRIRLEWNLPLMGSDEAHEPSYKVKSNSELTEEERAERKRRLNVIHSRRKRHRDRMEQETLQRQVDQLQAEQQRILAEKDRLSSLWNDAKKLTGLS